MYETSDCEIYCKSGHPLMKPCVLFPYTGYTEVHTYIYGFALQVHPHRRKPRPKCTILYKRELYMRNLLPWLQTMVHPWPM